MLEKISHDFSSWPPIYFLVDLDKCLTWWRPYCKSNEHLTQTEDEGVRGDIF